MPIDWKKLLEKYAAADINIDSFDTELDEVGVVANACVEQVLTEATIGDVADQINAEDNVVPADASKGIIEDTLDRALKVNKRINQTGRGDYINVLFVGEAGTGKTSRIRAWAQENGINLFEVRAAGMDDTDLGGAITPNKEGTTVNRLASTEFDILDQPNSVLFLDEYNRAPGSVRTNLLELINSHVVPDPREPRGQRKLKGFLFTVAAINPATSGYNTDDLDMAEKTRFRKVNVPAEKANLLHHLEKVFKADLEDAKGDAEWEKEIKGRLALAQTLLKSKDFKFDNRADIEKTEDTGNGVALNNRTLTQLLTNCDGTKQDFLDQWNDFCNDQKKTMAERILHNYVDVEDKANDALKGHDSESNVFKSSKTNWDKVSDFLNNLNN